VPRLKLHNAGGAGLFVLIMSLLASIINAETPSSLQRGGDFSVTSSAALTRLAWTALAAKDFDAVAAYTAKCRELYEAEARRQQSGLTAVIPASERERIFSLSSLNDVAVCYLVAGQGLELQGNTSAAIALYQSLNEKFPFAQCWDNKGWFWRPAAVARTRLYHLEFDAASR